MQENKKFILEKFDKLKGQHVLIHDKVLRFIAIAQDRYDYLYVMWDGKNIHQKTILDRMSQLKGNIEDEHYQDFIRVSELNDSDSDNRFGPRNEKEKIETKLEANKVKTKIQHELNETNDLDFELLSEICWELN